MPLALAGRIVRIVSRHLRPATLGNTVVERIVPWHWGRPRQRRAPKARPPYGRQDRLRSATLGNTLDLPPSYCLAVGRRGDVQRLAAAWLPYLQPPVLSPKGFAVIGEASRQRKSEGSPQSAPLWVSAALRQPHCGWVGPWHRSAQARREPHAALAL